MTSTPGEYASYVLDNAGLAGAGRLKELPEWRGTLKVPSRLSLSSLVTCPEPQDPSCGFKHALQLFTVRARGKRGSVGSVVRSFRVTNQPDTDRSCSSMSSDMFLVGPNNHLAWNWEGRTEKGWEWFARDSSILHIQDKLPVFLANITAFKAQAPPGAKMAPFGFQER
jgi:hypothetical protein